MTSDSSSPFLLESFGVRTASGWTSTRLSAEANRGESLALIGRAGSGKTLIFEQLVGVARPGVETLGKAQLGRISWVPQDARLAVLPTDRVWSLLGLSGFKIRLKQLTGARIAQTAAELRSLDLLKNLGLDPERVAEMPFRELSATERRCVLFARALLADPDVLLIDGWDEQMDGASRKVIGEVLREQMHRGLAVVLASRRYPLPDFQETRALSLEDADAPEAPVPLLSKASPKTAHEHVLLEVNRLTVERKRLGMFKRRASAFVLDGASLFVRHGESLALLGVRGAGKSTLLEAISGLTQATRGTLRVDGNDVTQARGRRVRRLRRQVQLVFQDAASVLDGHRTVQAHLEEAMALKRGLPGSPAEWLERLGLSSRLLRAPADQLSASEGQRVDLARSLVVAPKLVLFDAPEVSGAGEDGGVLAALIRAEKAHGRAFLIATSKPELARSLSDRVAILHAGRIVELGPTEEVLERPGHPLTVALLSNGAIPNHDPTRPSAGCPFVSKCERRQLPHCNEKEPMLAPLQPLSGATTELEPGTRRVACFHPIVFDDSVPSTGRGA